MNKYIKGKNVNLFVDGQTVAASTSCQFTLTGNTADAAAKSDPGNGMFDNPEFTHNSWTASNESFVVDVAYLLTLLDKVVNGNAEVEVTFQVSDKLSLTGRAIVSQIQLSAPNGDYAKLTLSLEGSGSLYKAAGIHTPQTITAARIKGKPLMVAIGDDNHEYHTLAASTSHTLSVSVQTAEVSTKDDNDLYSFKEVTGKSVSLSTDNLVSFSTDTDAPSDVTGIFMERLLAAVEAGETLKMSLGYYSNSVGAPAGSDVDHGTGTPLLVYGDFICTSVNVTGAVKDNATYTAEFTAKGAPSVGVMSA